MVMKTRFYLFLVSALVVLSAFAPNNGNALTKRTQNRVNKEVKNIFAVEEFDLVQSNINIPLNPFLVNQAMREIKSNDELLGYAFLGTAPSKTDTFEYLILFDTEFIIKKATVLVYREDYGGEIASKRWLSQFVKNQDSKAFVFGNNISAISGATISVQSMTASVNHVFSSLKEQKIAGLN